MLPIQMFLSFHINTILLFPIKIHNKLVRRWVKMDLSGLKNNYYWISLSSGISALIHSTKSTSMKQLKCDMQKWLKTCSHTDPMMNKVVLQTEKKREKK
jgi:hypothetical protein